MNTPYPIRFSSRRVESEAVPPQGGTQGFDTAAAFEINRARLEHLDSLGLDLSGKSVLDVGCGVGHLAQYFVRNDCKVVCLDGREENIERLKSLYPGLEAHVANVEDRFDRFGQFDIVFSYGLLYHLGNPVRALRNMAAVAREMLIVETMVCDHELPVMLLEDETRSFTQALDGLGSRPSPSFVTMVLDRIGFDFIYVPKKRPEYPDFDVSWENSLASVQQGHPLRCVFVGSRTPIASAGLVAARAGRSPLGEPAVALVRRIGRLDLTGMQVAGGDSEVAIQGQGVTVTTPPARWAYGGRLAVMPLPPAKALALRVSCRVLEGTAAIGVLDADERSFQSQEVVERSDFDVDVVLQVVVPERAGPLIVRSGPEDESCKVVVRTVEVWQADVSKRP